MMITARTRRLYLRVAPDELVCRLLREAFQEWLQGELLSHRSQPVQMQARFRQLLADVIPEQRELLSLFALLNRHAGELLCQRTRVAGDNLKVPFRVRRRVRV